MRLDATAVAVLMQMTEVPLTLDDAALANLLEARGIHALAGGGPAPVDRALRMLPVERLARAGVHPGKDAVCGDVLRHLEILRDDLAPHDIRASREAIADAFDARDGWWLRAKGLRAVFQEDAARRVVEAIRHVDDLAMENEDALDLVADLAEQRCIAAPDPDLTIWRIVAAFQGDLGDEDGGVGTDEGVDDADDADDADDPPRPAGEQENLVYRTLPNNTPLAIVARDGKLLPAVLEGYVAGQFDQATRKSIEDRLDSDAAESKRFEAHREAFAARELARTLDRSAAAAKASVEWAGNVTLLCRRASPRMAASSPARDDERGRASQMAAYTREMSFELNPTMGDGGDTFVTIHAWLRGGEVTCRLEVWTQDESAADYKLHAVYPLCADERGRVSSTLPLMSIAAMVIKFRLVRA